MKHQFYYKPNQSSQHSFAHLIGRMEQQETDTDAESGNGHGKWKILQQVNLDLWLETCEPKLAI